jgi:hypothetical protein
MSVEITFTLYLVAMAINLKSIDKKKKIITFTKKTTVFFKTYYFKKPLIGS